MISDKDAGPPPGPDVDDPNEPLAPRSWRLTFDYEGDDVRLVDRQRVAMLAPIDDAPLLDQGQEGFWVELRDESEASVYRQVLHEPIRRQYEVFSPEPGALPHHVAEPNVRGRFQVVVPDLAAGVVIALHAPAVPPDDEAEGAEDREAPDGTEPTPPDEQQRAGRRRRPARRSPRTLLVAPLREEDAPRPEEDDDGQG